MHALLATTTQPEANHAEANDHHHPSCGLGHRPQTSKANARIWARACPVDTRVAGQEETVAQIGGGKRRCEVLKALAIIAQIADLNAIEQKFAERNRQVAAAGRIRIRARLDAERIDRTSR